MSGCKSCAAPAVSTYLLPTILKTFRATYPNVRLGVKTGHTEEVLELVLRQEVNIGLGRPIRHPVETFPLAICDARSIAFEDFVISERRYPNRVGQTYAITYNPEHRWYWLPRMRRDEALVFKVFDSSKDGRARWSAHTAFEDPTSPPNARPRESIEIRTLAFF